jgi:hypothetical protein
MMAGRKKDTSHWDDSTLNVYLINSRMNRVDGYIYEDINESTRYVHVERVINTRYVSIL